MPDVRPGAEAALAAGVGEAVEFRGELADDEVEVSPVGELTLAEVVRRTARNSAEVQVAMARVREAQAGAKQARLLPNPVLSMALRFPERGTAIIDAGLSADLIAVLRIPGAVSAADSRLRAESAAAVTVVLDELAAAQEQYFTIQSIEAGVAVLGERRELLRQLQGLAGSKLRVGEGTRLDVMTLQTQQVELETEIADAEMQLQDARLALARLMGQPSGRVGREVSAWAAPGMLTLEEGVVIGAALRHRPEVLGKVWELAALGDERGLAGWDVWEGTEVGAAAERDGDWSVGPAAAVPIPLLDMGQGQRERAIAAVTGARHELTAARRQVIEEVRRAVATLTATRSNLDRVVTRLLPLQEDRLRQAEAQFRAGQTDITTLLVAEQDLRASRGKAIELQRQVAIAQVRLERSVGGAGVLRALAAGVSGEIYSTTLPADGSSPTTRRTP